MTGKGEGRRWGGMGALGQGLRETWTGAGPSREQTDQRTEKTWGGGIPTFGGEEVR